MTHEPLAPLISAWLRGTDRPPVDSRRSTSQIMARLPEREARRGWPSFRASKRRSQTPTTSDTISYEPTLTAVANGPSPTTIGRTRSMVSPAKAISAAAIAFGLGGVLLIAHPFDRHEVVPGAAIEQGASAPVAVTATTSAGPCPGTQTTQTIGAVERMVGGTCQPTWTWSDDRLNGEVTWAENKDVYLDGSGLTIDVLALSFENDEGAWRMRPLPRVAFPDAPATAADVWILDGEGAYEGLTAVLLVDEYVPHGYIIDAGLPPAPENASTK